LFDIIILLFIFDLQNEIKQSTYLVVVLHNRKFVNQTLYYNIEKGLSFTTSLF